MCCLLLFWVLLGCVVLCCVVLYYSKLHQTESHFLHVCLVNNVSDEHDSVDQNSNNSDHDKSHQNGNAGNTIILL